MADHPPSAAVLERCTIQPPPHAAELTLPLVHFDIKWLHFHAVHRLIFFDLRCSKSHFLQSILPQFKQSLIQTLSHFLPLAGKIVRPLNSGRRPYSRFAAGDSVSLTVAESDLDFAELTGNHPRAADDFYACVPRLPPAERTSDNDVVLPVLALQMTLFPDHGVCLGFTNHHAIGDASSVVRFIKAWATVSKHGGDAKLIGENPQLLPSFDRAAVADPDGLDSYYWNLMKQSRAVESPPVSFPLNKHRATFVLTADDVQRLKHHVQFKSSRPELRATSFTVACAFVWVCLARAEEAAADDDETEYLCFAADCRGRLQPPLPAAYFGNCLALVKVETAHGVLRGGGGVAAAATSIAEAIEKTVNNEKGILEGAEEWPKEFGKMIGKRLFGVAGSPRFDLYDVDYGWGRPRKFESPSIDSDTSMSLCKSRDFEGGLEIGLSRPIQVLDAFAAVFYQSLKNL
ncbi:malonyl-coenzyme:anthocyanin 5-O-glucoside-6'''-O-malonyltransferase-like [Salvia miltiorrhiza]|uniref:malonyl-coenzyme:anthocyanin 5-O-glucoside-6'''-O-malonyltransferase-like n=1 Tax=Salvia miltiorrhiza TaxID=226208 RepID=UPI0025ACC5F0|nr:malonyl-coenzyme:anthocyanin 5-O-glucoside-6'''-O-malonyltransferase-like [Salvia miltiorrhiza]